MSKQAKRGMRYTVGAATLAAVVCLAGNTWWLFSNIVNVMSASDWVEEQAAVQYELARIESALLNAETGQRGYVLTGNAAYLSPYHLSKASTSTLLATLTNAFSGNAKQSALVAELTSRVRDKFDEMSGTLAVMAIDGQANARSRIASGLGMQIMDDIRRIIAELERLSEGELAVRYAEQSDARTSALAALGIFVAATLFLIGALLFVSYRELRRRRLDASEIEGYADSLGRSLAELKQERNEIRALHEAAGFLQSCDTVAELAAVLTSALEKMFSEFDGHVMVHAPSRNRLDCILSFGGPGSVHPIAPSDCWALRRGQDHVHRANDASPVCLHFTLNRLAIGTEDTICIPLIAHGDTIGLLSMALNHHRLPEGAPAAEVLEAASHRAERLATQLGLTLANLKLRESLRQQAIRDALTNAFNRRYLDDIGDKILAQSHRFAQDVAVVMLDVDHFKDFNDLHGHQSGDHALIAVAQFIQSQIREADWLFRYGGEEFLIILQGLNREHSQAKLEEIREGVANLQFTNGETALPSVTISLGCAFYDHRMPTSLSELIADADEALYNAKGNGRNRLQLAASPTIAAAVA